MTRRACEVVSAAAAVLALAVAPPVSAQEARFGSAAAPAPSQLPAGGWNITPSVAYSGSWDDNVLLKSRGDNPLADYLNVVNPRADAEFTGRRGQFSGSYDGAFLIYRDLNSLNSYDQHGSIAARRQLSKHLAVFVNETLAISPTTALSVLVGVPFLRTGSSINDLRSGIEVDLTKRTSIMAAYEFDWVRFDENSAFGAPLLGGHSHGGLFFLRHRRSEHTALTFTYDRRLSRFGGPQTFDIQNAAAGFERTFSEALKVYAAAGVSHVGEDAFGPAHTSPRYHAGVTQRVRTGTFDVMFDRSFVPAFGFGGTTESKELSVRLNLPLSRRVYTGSSFSWRDNRYLQFDDDARLRSRWFEASIGYLARPWMRIEGFYGSAFQTTTLPGGAIDRNRFGVQVITAKPLRIR